MIGADFCYGFRILGPIWTERRLVDAAVDPHAIAPNPARRRAFQAAREPAVRREQQQSLGIQVEPADRNHARHLGWQFFKYSRPTLWITMGRDQSRRFMITPQSGRRRLGNRLSFD